MRSPLIVAVIALAALCTGTGDASAQYSPAATRVTCESKEGQQVECEMNTQGHVVLVQQLSRTRCVEGQNWGLFKHSVWVNGGCRGVFALEGQNGPQGSRGNGAVVGLPTRVTCASEGGQRTECEMNTSGEVRIATQLSRTACVEGQNWGLFKHSVWVSGGCRAVFVSGRDLPAAAPSPAQRRTPTNAQIAACNAVDDRYGEVVSSTPLRPGAFEIILHYDDGQYVCNVDASNKVSFFEKLRR